MQHAGAFVSTDRLIIEVEDVRGVALVVDSAAAICLLLRHLLASVLLDEFILLNCVPRKYAPASHVRFTHVQMLVAPHLDIDVGAHQLRIGL